jgi:hypothetical protein
MAFEQSTMEKSLIKEMVQNHWKYNEKIVDLSYEIFLYVCNDTWYKTWCGG